MTAELGANHSPFLSFQMGGFEGACFSFWDGRKVDSISASHHDRHCRLDYEILAQAGIRTVRDSFRWPLIETAPGRYDWSSVLPMLQAASETGTQVVWDLCHFGIPDCIDAHGLAFPKQFAAFAAAAARLVRSIDARPQWWCPINEISYWCYAAGEKAYMAPTVEGGARFLKLQLAAAYLDARDAIASVDSRSKFLATDPLICVADNVGNVCEASRGAGFETFDMLLGHIDKELEGRQDAVDILGLNYYPGNQWQAANGATIGMGQKGYRPLRFLLADVWARYRKPLLLSETGAERPNSDNWMTYVQNEVREALAAGIPVLGICHYPIMDYPGWLDNRHCECGIIGLDERFERRTARPSSPK